MRGAGIALPRRAAQTMDAAKENGGLAPPAPDVPARRGGLRGLKSRIDLLRYDPLGMRAVKGWRLLTAPREYVVRRAAARAALRTAPPAVRIDERLGYGTFGPGEVAGTEALLQQCARVFGELAPHLADIQEAQVGNRRVTIDLFSDDRLRDEPAFVDFALADPVLLPVMRYLCTVPFLARVVLGVSLHCPELSEPTYHQRFHVDNDDFRLLRVYVNAADVTAADGPLCILPADVSARVLAHLRRGRPSQGRYESYCDEEIFRHCDPSEVVRLTGPRGAGGFVDLARCLHYGSRVEPGGQRLVYVLSFHRYHRIHDNASNHLDGARESDRLRRLVLAPPRSFPHGYFCPDPVVEAQRARAARAAPAPR